ncbi:hypothetical protein J2J97_31975 (plasmid) [Rhizobium bangladeshense]|uniref:hypothetical protein n=1 Tax=Rhizobium bangladeshense TaxID=1138189 RepID=UPI001A997CE4|nr:hypothetical protein [Rhizobium bangladeshense]QSY98691.1 hypothetical protein J2J97_31975 [Rhizobium bangladeshense]
MSRLLDFVSGRGVPRDGQSIVSSIRRIVDAPMPVIPQNFLIDILDAMDRAPEVRRLGTGEGEYGHYTHVSSLIDICARQHALAAQDDRVIQESVTGGHRVMWAMGRYVEKHIRSQFLKAGGGRNAFGRWTCLCGNAEHVGHRPHQRLCLQCQQGLEQYNEFTLFDHENWIKGNPDLLTVFPGDWFVPIEIKSMNKKDFDALTAAKGDHIFQIGHYRRMLELSGFRTHTHGVIIYCTKDFKYGSPYKEFHVDLTASSVINIIDQSVAVARQLRESRENDTLPPRTLCSAHSDARAKQCPFLVSCFSR